jgi:nucleoside-diphosphate-sugar epimerase
VSFRPQYIYGEKSNKWDYIDWYFDRLVRGEPLAIPAPGTQKVSLTNSADVASLLSSVLNDEAAAVEQKFFNCGTDELVSYDEVARLCADISGTTLNIQHYDPELGKAKFPFRLTDFYVSPDLAKSKLGWKGPQHSLKDDLEWYFESYKARGGLTKDMSFAADKEVLIA